MNGGCWPREGKEGGGGNGDSRVVIGQGDGGGATVAADGMGREGREEGMVVMLGEVVAVVVVKVADGGCEFVAFLPFEEELSNLFATALVGRGGLLLVLLLFLVLVVDRAETVLGIACLVFCLCVLGLQLPYALFFEWESFPAVAWEGVSVGRTCGAFTYQ